MHNRHSGLEPESRNRESRLDDTAWPRDAAALGELCKGLLSGKIPPELDSLVNLVGLDLRSNRLSGRIPTELGNLSNMAWLELDDNQLNGQIPPEFARLFDLSILNLRRNQLSGELPSGLTELSALTELRFDENADLCAPDDDAFQEWLNGIRRRSGDRCDPDQPSDDRGALVALYNATDGPNWSKNANWLSDAPVDTWYGVTADDGGRVSELRLSENRMSGQIPMELGTLSNLAMLHLDGNRLTGQVPTELGRLSNLAALRLDGNQLSGALSHVLTELSALTELYFDDNAGLCAPADDAFQEWLNGISNRSGDVCPSDPARDHTPTPTAAVAPVPAPTNTPVAAYTPAPPDDDADIGDAGGGCNLRAGSSVFDGAGDVALMALPLLGLMGLAGRRRWSRPSRRLGNRHG